MSEQVVQKLPPAQEFAGHWWKALFNASEDAQIVCRLNGIVECINPKAARQFGLKPGADEGVISIFKILSSPASQKLGRIFKFRSDRAELLHSVNVLRDGSSYLLMDIEIIPLGESFTLVTFKDSSRRLRLESHVQRLITAIDATPDVFLVTDADLRITFVNPAFQSATGYHLEDVLGRSDDFLRAPFEREKVRVYRDVVSRGREWSGEFVNVRCNGELYHVESTVSPIADMAGRFMGYVICERDVTARKHLQDALRVERDFVRSILQSLDGAIYSLDCKFRLTHANDGWRRLPAEHAGIQLRSAPEMGRALLDDVPNAERRAELQSIFQEVIRQGQAQDNHYHGPDGRYWLMKISPWTDNGRVQGLICNITDQTRYHELQNQLFQSQKMEIIGTLAAGVAHDFNNLLQVIRGHTNLVLAQAPPESPVRHGLEKIDTAAIRAAEITRQLLSFSRVADERRVVLDLNRVIHEASELARRTLRGDVTVVLNPAPEPVCVKMDPTKASQALLNLCVNAQDAMPAGGHLTLTNSVLGLPPALAARHNAPAGAFFARCSVTDTGCGIARDVLPRIFEPFFTTKEKGKGTGLGLPIVRRAAEEAGGFVEVESVLHCGSTFHLYLPLAAEQLTPRAASAHLPIARGQGRVLVVDDIDLLREFTQTFLQTTGLTVFVAGGGQQALSLMEELAEPVDLVFTDYNMPGMNGLELIERIIVRWPKTKFVVASGYLNEEATRRLRKCRAEIIAKPYDMHDASKVIMQRLANEE